MWGWPGCHTFARSLSLGVAPHRGSHQFQHALPVRMLQGGASLGEIGEVLHHQRPQATSIYARVHIDALRSLAMP
jgi:site-specific recombinase XerD